MDDHDPDNNDGPRVLAGRTRGYEAIPVLVDSAIAAGALAASLHARLAARERERADRIRETLGGLRAELTTLVDNSMPLLAGVGYEAVSALEHNAAAAESRAAEHDSESHRACKLALREALLGVGPRVEGNRLLFGPGASSYVRSLTKRLWPLVDTIGDKEDHEEFARLHAQRFDTVAKTAGMDASPFHAGDCVGPYSEDRSLVAEW